VIYVTFQFKLVVRAALGIGLVCTSALHAAAQSTTHSLDVRGQFRDGAIDTSHGQFFVTSYDRDTVWRIDPATGKVATRINVGDGPVALAQDGAVLACVNRLGNSVTLIRLSDLSILATVEVEKGPGDIAVLGEGRFVVANSFSDSLSLIDTRGSISVITLEDSPSVPVSVGATSEHLVALSRADNRLYLYGASDLRLVKSVPLPNDVTGVKAAGTSAIVFGKSSLSRVDLPSGNVTHSVPLAVSDVEVAGDTIHVVTGDSYRRYGLDLSLLEERSLTESATVVVARDNILALLDPKEGHLQAANLGLLTPRVAPVTTATTDAPATTGDSTMVIVEAKPVNDASPESAPAETAAAPPIVEEAAPADETMSETAAPEPTPVSETAPADMPDDAPASTTQTSQGIRHNPIVTQGVRAPSPGRPSVSPLQQLSRKTIADAVVRPTEFGSSEGGFQAPDLTKPLENIKFSTAKRTASDAPTTYNDFRAELGDMKMKSDSFTHEQDPVEVHAEGNVLITQQSSSIAADLIHYKLEPGEEQEDARATVLKGDEADSGAPLDQGQLTLENAHIIEPTREMTAEHLEYDFKTGKGELSNAKGQAGIYYFSADKLHLHGPQTLSGDDVWVTTCDRPNPHYRIRLSDVEMVDGQPVGGSNARLQLGKANTPFYLPKWRRGSVGGSPWNVSFDSGRQAETGYYVNVGQQYEVSPDVGIGPRIFATEKEGVGFGADLSYDFMENPASPFYRTKGEANALYTTKDRGYVHWYHRYEYSNDLVVRAQVEHWGDKDFYKDFYYDLYRNRSLPRSFANVTYRQPSYIATGTVRMQSHGWFNQTEQAPEVSYHLLERDLGENFYFSFDTVNGYYNREPRGIGAGRSVNVARLTYNWDPHPAVAITPFLQLDASGYTQDRKNDSTRGRLGATAGITAQTRLTRTYGGRWGFSAIKHIVVPSITYTYRPETNVEAPEIPQFDPLDSDFGRSRVELKLSNVFYGRDAESGEVWQIGRVTLYQGNDFWNETRKTEDYEIEIDVRPRPWWGFQLVGERQSTADDDSSLGRFSLARNYPRFYEVVIGDVFGGVNAQDFSSRFGDYNRVLSQVYYDGETRGNKFTGRVGFAYTETQSQVFNREALYGLGYKISDKWGFGFEHTYDLEDDSLRSQTYELRRSLHCWETAIRFRDRESGFDINFEFNIKAFPGSRLKF